MGISVSTSRPCPFPTARQVSFQFVRLAPGLPGLRPTQPFQQKIFQVSPAIEHSHDANDGAIDTIDDAPWSHDQFTVLADAMLVKFRHDPSPSGEFVQDRGMFPKATKHVQCGRNVVPGDELHDPPKILLGGDGPDDSGRTLCGQDFFGDFATKRASMRAKTASCPATRPVRISSSPRTISFRRAMALRMPS